VHALAFDHRQQFEALAVRTGAGPQRIAAFKRLIAESVRAAVPEDPAAGAIVDDRYGRDSLFGLTGQGLWLARPIEQPGITPLAFEGGDDPALTLRAWPAEHVVKCLVNYGVGDAPEMRALQEERLLRLQRACIATNHELLLEVLPPQGDGQGIDGLADAVQRLYATDLKPDWWKLPPMRESSQWRDVGSLIRSNDPQCRGVLVLGHDSSDDGLQESFAASASEPLVKGFAVGRFIFWSVAEQWFAGRLSDSQAIRRLLERYRHVLNLWRSTRTS
jgi:5-dehydro-2-deoxygluconokinase